jgi:hypothetical protein
LAGMAPRLAVQKQDSNLSAVPAMTSLIYSYISRASLLPSPLSLVHGRVASARRVTGRPSPRHGSDLPRGRRIKGSQRTSAAAPDRYSETVRSFKEARIPILPDS